MSELNKGESTSSAEVTNVTITGDFEEPTSEDNNISKIGRNDPCYCNSGKKYKKCHGK